MLGRGLLGADAPEQFAAFGLTTGRVIALAWSDPTFHDALYRADDARQLVQDAMDIVVPWNFRLKFREYEVKHTKPHPGLAELDGLELDRFLSSVHFDVDKLPFTVIRLNMPEKPEGAQRAIALAAYNDTGAQYPFTCG
jgi:ribosomally synthesized peptide (two-chain TOMM family)